MKIAPFIISLASVFSLTTICEAQQRVYREQTVPYRNTDDVSRTVSELKNDQKNQNMEIKRVQEHIKNLDVTIDDIREKVDGALNQINSGVIKEASYLKEKLDSILDDVGELSTNLSEMKAKSDTLENRQNKQAENIRHLEAATHKIMDALGIKKESGNVHIVTPGDSLGGIAIKYGTTIKALKQANNLPNDKILIGQRIKIPTQHD